jgi:selenocysteine lyase/cysteine desulfurase
MPTSWEPDVSEVALGDRTLFADLEPRAYLAHAAVSPASSEVRRAVVRVADDYARHGFGAFGRWRAQRERLRARLARLIGARASDVALVANTTTSVSDVALSIPWSRGDRIVCFRGEFPANVTPWREAARTFGLEVGFLDADAFRTDEGVHALERELARGVRLVAVSAVEFATGLAMPIDAIAERAHAAGAEVFVDAIQACGVLPIDVARAGIDYLGCGSHKWLMGMEGAAFLYVRPDRIASLVPRVAGWLSHEDPIRFLVEGGSGHLRYDRPIRTDVTLFEGGAPNVLGLAALEAGVAPIEALGVETIFDHVQRYLDPLEAGLVERGFASERSADAAGRSGILSVVPPSGVDLVRLAAELLALGVVASTPDGRLRFAPHWPNRHDEVPAVLEALDLALKRAR